MTKDNDSGLERRKFLVGAGAIAGAAATVGVNPARAAAGGAPQWNLEVDVVCVGSGAAACAAAVTAAARGAEVAVLEKLPLTGGTTGKSGGVTWIPNHPYLRARGIVDAREDCLKYLARYAYPQEYTPNSPTLGLTQRNYQLLEAFYDHGSETIEFLQDNGIVQFREFRMWEVDTYPPDYADHLPENKVPRGRSLEPAVGAGSTEGGGSLAGQMAAWLEARDVPVLTDHRVTAVIKSGDRVVGVEADHLGKTVRIGARKGVIFGTGGYAHNTALIDLHQPALHASCASPGATGDFIAIAQAAGAGMGAMHNAWRTQVVLEEALVNRVMGFCAFVLPGDSMIVVNKYGKRITNEKRNYNDRTRTHFHYDPTREEYPNQLQFMVFDQRSLDAFGGAYPIPSDPRESPYLISGEDWGELSRNITARLDKVADQCGGVTLAPGFAAELKASVERFNGYAQHGVDPEFQRGEHRYDSDWHKLFSTRRAGTTQPENTLPSPVMHPFADTGPYHAFILAAGALDTCGGPLIDHNAQVLDSSDRPIPGLFGAGNCIASPTRQAYAGAGGTIGPALTFGYIAANRALDT